MSRDYEPVPSQWYENIEEEESFRVLSVDEDSELIEIEYLDGDIEELDVEAWHEMDLERIAEPEGWAASQAEEEEEEEEDEEDWDEDEDEDEDEEDEDEDLDEERGPQLLLTRERPSLEKARSIPKVTVPPAARACAVLERNPLI